MKQFNHLLLFVTAMVFPIVSQARVILRQSFDDTDVFASGPFTAGKAADAVGGSWRVNAAAPDDFKITTERSATAPHALKVLRQTRAGAAILEFHPAISYDFTFECKVFCAEGDGVVLHLNKTGAGKVFAGILLQADRKPAAYNAQMGWMPDSKLPALPASQWFTCRVVFNAGERLYMLHIVTADGEEYIGEQIYPMTVDGVCDCVHFINILPVGCQSYIDDVLVTQSDEPALGNRTLLNPKASSPDAALSAVLSGKAGASYTARPNQSAVIEFSPEVDVNALILKTDQNAPLPTVTVKALNLLGHWVDWGGGLSADEHGVLIVPQTQKVTKLTLDFAAPVVLSACLIYSPLSAGQGKLDMDFAAKVDAEYRLPVYDLQYAGHDRAQLTFVNHTDADISVIVTLHERTIGKDYGTPRELSLPPGKSDVFYDLKGIPNGEYVTRIVDYSNPDAAKHGTLERLLRLRTSPKCAVSPRKDVTGQKLFFPDGFYLAESDGINFIPAVAERHLAVRGTPGEDDKWVYFADDIFIDRDGRIRINYHTLNRLWQTDSIRRFNAVAMDDSMDKWESREGAVTVPPQKRPFEEKLPPAAKPDWQPKPGPDGKITYHFYDAEKDGPVRLNQVNLDMISPSAAGTVGFQKYDWKILKPSPCTIWPVWYKAPGEAVILSRSPLVDTFPPSGTIEPANSGSDLGFGQWLSDDGKILFMGHGRHLIRYMPYIARYDNLHDRARIVAVWRTDDGLHWEQNYVAPPSDNKPPADQSYGGAHIRIPEGAGLRVGFFNRYSACFQQISWELIYSWDGFRWTRFQDKPPFMPNGPMGDFFYGGGYVGLKAIEKDGKIYQLMSWANDHCHFQSEIVHGSSLSAKGFTADYMKRRYAPRHLDEWPLFQKDFGGSWEKLSEHTRNATSGFGVMVYRKDGFFAATAGNDVARMVTVPVTAKGSLMANAIVENDGFMDVSIMQGGKPLDGFTRHLGTCDNVAIPIFERLPDGEFQLKITMKNSRLYTLEF